MLSRIILFRSVIKTIYSRTRARITICSDIDKFSMFNYDAKQYIMSVLIFINHSLLNLSWLMRWYQNFISRNKRGFPVKQWDLSLNCSLVSQQNKGIIPHDIIKYFTLYTHRVKVWLSRTSLYNFTLWWNIRWRGSSIFLHVISL